MEDDDEFGDLYSDVLQPFASSFAAQPSQIQSTTASLSRPMDINIRSVDEEVTHGAPNLNSSTKFYFSDQSRNLVSEHEKAAPALITRQNFEVGDKSDNQQVGKEKDLAGFGNNWASDSMEQADNRVLESGGDVKIHKKALDNPTDVSGMGVVDHRDDKDVLVENDEILMTKAEKFDLEEVDSGIGDLVAEPIIPGLSITGASDAANIEGRAQKEASGGGDDWDSDSEDDLQIVLNDNDYGPMGMDTTGVMGVDDDDEEDGEPLVIVSDTDPNHQSVDGQERGDDTTQGADGEKKELGDAPKVIVGVDAASKIGYNVHGYHPFHYQFKYVRPGATQTPGLSPAGPGGVSSQVRPPANMGPIPGRGRGDWRPTGIKNASPVQKSFHSGLGMSSWGSSTSGRAFGSGPEFTLPSHKTIFDVEVDSFEEKPWRLSGVDTSAFFNFGFNEESWKDYCKQLEILRLEATMQSKIRVYESGRTEPEYDPDLPPELAAAAGVQVVSSEKSNVGKTHAGNQDFPKGSAFVRPPLPPGRAIPVESGCGERLPSIDTRPPRIRDSDAIIEIVLQDSADDDSFPGNGDAKRPENDHAREDLRGDNGIEENIALEDHEHCDGFPSASNGRKRKLVGRRAPLVNSFCDNPSEGDRSLPLPPEAPSLDSRGQTSGKNFGVPQVETWTKKRAHDRSPYVTPSEGTQDKRSMDNQKEESVESIGGKLGPLLSSPGSSGSAGEPRVEHGESMHDECLLKDGDCGNEEGVIMKDLNKTIVTVKDANLMQSVTKQKLSSPIEESHLRGINDTEDLMAARSSQNSKARSGSSTDDQKLHDSVDEEVVQDGFSTHTGNSKSSNGEDEHSTPKKGHEEREEIEKHHMVVKGREGSYTHRDRGPNLAHHAHSKTEITARQKERDDFDRAWQQKDDKLHGRRIRAEDTRKGVRGDEMGSRNRSKVRESERNKVEHLQLRKQLDDVSCKVHHEKDKGSRHRERDDNLKGQYDNMDDLRGKRRKGEENLRDYTGKEEIFHSRENSRKQERGDVIDMRKRDGQARMRDDDNHSLRPKEEVWFQRDRGERQRERDEWHRTKQSHEASLSKREREGMRAGRAAEDKVLISHARVKDDHKRSDRDYQLKEIGRQSEQPKRRDRVEDEIRQHRGREIMHARGNQLSIDERRYRHEREASHNHRAVNASDNHKVHERKPKENARRGRESEGSVHNSLGHSKRNHEAHGGRINEMVTLKGTSEQGNGKHEIGLTHSSSRKHRHDGSSDDEHQDSSRGRSKMERWTSHKERDFNISTKSSSLEVKISDTYDNGASSSARRLPDKSSRVVESIDDKHHLHDAEDAGDVEMKDVDVKPVDRHLDTVEKLKKRTERFKLPMPSDKDAMGIKKMESEPLPPSQSETCADSDIKQERPPRKRRWISN